MPASIAIGFVIFSFTVLLHEVVHRTVFAGRRHAGNAALGLVYGVVGGLARAQFTRWHLDHHEWLGTDDRDPKRAPPDAEAREALVQGALPDAGPVPDLLPRGGPRRPRRYEPALRGADPAASAWSRRRSTWAAS